MAYQELRPVIAINILNFDVFDYTERFHTSYHLYEDEDQFKLTNIMEFHFIEMGKLIKDWKANKLDPWNSVLARWLLLLGMVNSRKGEVYEAIYQELEEIAMKDKSLSDTFKSWEELSMEQEQRDIYEGRLKQVLDEEAAKRAAELRVEEARKKAEQAEQEGRQEGLQKGRQEGKQEGKQEGRQEGRQEEKEAIARRLLAGGLGLEFVSESTGLTEDKVSEIQRHMKK